jgi:hypothetical protein
MTSPLQAVITSSQILLPLPSNTVPQIYILTLRGHTEFISIVNVIAKTHYENAHDIMSNG